MGKSPALKSKRLTYASNRLNLFVAKMAQAYVLRNTLTPELAGLVGQFASDRLQPHPTAALIKSLHFEYTEEHYLPVYRNKSLIVCAFGRDHFCVLTTRRLVERLSGLNFLLTDFQPSGWSSYFERELTDRFFQSSMQEAGGRIQIEFSKMFD